MKKQKRKIIFALITVFAFIGITYALNTFISIDGGLKNNIVSGSAKRNTISGTAELSEAFYAYMTNVENVNGNNASGGIRVKITAKKYDLIGIKIREKELEIPVYPTTTTSSKAWFYFDKGGNKTKVEWENWTGDTSFDAKFKAENR